ESKSAAAKQLRGKQRWQNSNTNSKNNNNNNKSPANNNIISLTH
ncbi:hypothetical protein M5D96_008815, partial [Drosophila gunungcola]